MLVLMGFFVVFAIAGTQLLSGVLKNRCIHIDTGKIYDSDPTWSPYICGGK
jgi:hypothetical protein